jgi:hypothetical protein
MSIETIEPDVVIDAPASVLSIVPDLPDEPEEVIDTVSTADLPGIVAELVDTLGRIDVATTALAELKDTVRAWFVKFTKDAWECGDGNLGSDSLCETWERYLAEVGVPGRPNRSPAVNADGQFRVPITAANLRSATSIGLTDAQARAMIAGLPEADRYTPRTANFNLRISQIDLDDKTWDPLSKTTQRCVCPQARIEYQTQARANYGRDVLVDLSRVRVQYCPATTHIPWKGEA